MERAKLMVTHGRPGEHTNSIKMKTALKVFRFIVLMHFVADEHKEFT